MAPESETPDSVSEEMELLYNLIGDKDLVTPIIGIGASALIPVPFLDDVVKRYLEKRLFRLIAERERQELSKEDQERLTEEEPSGCFVFGCLFNIFIYPFKRILRKLFFIAEIKRCVDQSTTALAQAWLFEMALRRSLWEPGKGPESASKMRHDMRSACREHGVKPLEVAISSAFQGAKGTLTDFALKFTKKGEDEEAVAQALDQLEKEDQTEIAGMTQRLKGSLSQVSEGYLEKFARTFEEQLKKPPEQTSA